MSEQPDIIYTKVDEAPQLASGSFLPIIQSFTQCCGCQCRDHGYFTRWPDYFSVSQRDLNRNNRLPDDLALLGEMVLDPER